MGQRQSSDQQNNQETNRRGRVLRPSSRVGVQRNDPLRRPSGIDNETRSRLNNNDNIPTMAFIPVNENQRRDERRRRREFLREHPGEREAADAIVSPVTALGSDTPQNATTTTTATMTTTEGATISPFSRMIAQVISQAVVTSFRNGQIPALNPDEQQLPGQSNVRQQLTMHLSSELFRQMEPENNEDMFIRFIRLPVLVTRIESPNSTTEESQQHEPQSQQQQSTSSQEQSTTIPIPTETTTIPTATTATTVTDAVTEEDSEVTRIIMLPVFLYGLRSSPPTSNVNSQETNQPESQEPQQNQENTSTREEQESQNAPEEQNTREETGEGQSTNRHWTIYVIGGNHVENIMSDSPSYEELLNLATLIGSVRQPTVSQEAIDNHLTIDKYTAQVKQTIVGNSEKCQVCLNDYQLDEDVRILSCHHGFHKDCIDQWLTQGQNKCPLCRKEAVPSTE